MTNAELSAKRQALAEKRRKLAGRSPFAAATEYAVAAELAAEIADELARRELAREDHHA